MATSNRLLPILVSIVVLMSVFVIMRSCSDDTNESTLLDTVPQAPAPDVDTPADTIKTLSANVAAMTTELEALRQANEKLRKENRYLVTNRSEIEQNVITRIQQRQVTQENETSKRTKADSSILSTLTERVDALSQSLAQIDPTSNHNEIPVGLGFDGFTMDDALSDELIWIEPLDALDTGSDGNASKRLLKPSKSSNHSPNKTSGKSKRSQEAPKTIIPVYTVPRNATLIGSTAMTALVGRIPVKDQVNDPMPFKIITGHQNLAANGLTVPGVQGMVWSGTAIGDWTLSCVTGRLESVTFIFDNGTIRTLSSNNGGGRSGSSESLGWISDQQGIPCITGERKTNAPAFLTQRIGVTAIQAAADAAAAAESTTLITDSGLVADQVNGDTGAYVLGKTVAGGSEEIADWLMERQAQSFDAVFVPAGVRVAIHVDQELPIDLDTQGRRLQHAQAVNPYRRTRLD